MIQFHFTVGVRGSISNVDRTEPLSFMYTLKALGITSQTNLEKLDDSKGGGEPLRPMI